MQMTDSKGPHLGVSHKWVVQAMDFDLDLKRLVVVFKCLWALALVIEH